MVEIDRFIKGIKSNAMSLGKLWTSYIVNPFKGMIDTQQKFLNTWKTKSDNDIKNELMDPSRRNNLWKNIKRAFKAGAIVQGCLWLNPIVLWYGLSKWWARRPANVAKLREEILTELPAEIEILDDKIKRAENNKDFKEMAQLKRVKAQLQMKLRQVAGQYQTVT